MVKCSCSCLAALLLLSAGALADGDSLASSWPPAEDASTRPLDWGSDLALVRSSADIWWRASGDAGSFRRGMVRQGAGPERLLGWFIHPTLAVMDTSAVWIRTGNEVGDPLFQEAVVGPDWGANLTPMFSLGAASPQYHGFSAGGFLHQVDHFSGQVASRRTGTLPKGETFAWFGENHPAVSRASAWAAWQGQEESRLQVSYSDEYFWVATPAERWIPLHLQSVDAAGQYGQLEGWLRREEQEVLDRDRTTFAKRLQGSASVRVLEDPCGSRPTLRLGVMASHDDSDPGFPILAERRTTMVPWTSLDWRLSRLDISVWTHAGPGGAGWHDTLSWIPMRSSGGLWMTLRNLASTDLDPLAPDLEVAPDGDTVRARSHGLYQLHSLMVGMDWNHGPWSGGLWTMPWWERGQSGSQRFALKDGGQWQWQKGRWSTGSWGGRIRVEATLEHVFGDTTDAPVRLPLAVAGGEVSVHLPSHLEALVGAHWRSSVVWREWNDSSQVDGRWNVSAGLRQGFVKDRIQLQASWLQVLGPVRRDHPDGDPERFRFLCGFSWLY